MCMVNIIIKCVSSSKLSILWNGGRTEEFKSSIGLRQGDPLSPYLFVLCIEKLALLIQDKVEAGYWKPVSVAKGGPGLTHLLFADDVLLFVEANNDQVEVVMDTLQTFCQASGLKVDVEKSKAMCSRLVLRQKKDNMKDISSISFVSDLGVYLGFFLVQGRVNHNVYNAVLDKIQRRMAAWKGRLVNKAGRVCLAKSVTSSILVLSM